MYSESFKKALATGKVLVRRIFSNENSKKDQVTVQFMQEIDVPASENQSVLVAMAQGVERPGKNLITTLFSFSRAAINALGLKEGNYFDGENVVHADKLFQGTEVNIQVTENNRKNPLAKEQEPKKNPTTGEPVLVNGEPVYRHTELVAGPVKNIFLNSTTARQAVVLAKPSITPVGVKQEFVD